MFWPAILTCTFLRPPSTVRRLVIVTVLLALALVRVLVLVLVLLVK